MNAVAYGRMSQSKPACSSHFGLWGRGRMLVMVGLDGSQLMLTSKVVALLAIVTNIWVFDVTGIITISLVLLAAIVSGRAKALSGEC